MTDSLPVTGQPNTPPPASGDGAETAAALARAMLAWADQQGLAISVKTADDGRYVQANEPLLRRFDRPLDQVLGHTDADLVDQGTAALLRSADHTALAQGQQLASDHRFEWRGVRRDFQVLRVVAMAGGRRVLCCIWQDTALQRQRDTQLRVALDQLEQQQKANDQLRRELAEQGLRDQASGLASTMLAGEGEAGTSWYDLTSQAFAVFLPVRSVGVMGDGRTYEHVVALRAVQTQDFMTAHWAHLPHELLGRVSNRIINEVRGINRVVYDISGKPPATIEWE